MSQDSFFGPTGSRTITPEVERAVEKISDIAGFRHLEPPPDPPKRRRGTTQHLHNFTMRLAITDAERFIRWCEAERIVYREGFARLGRVCKGWRIGVVWPMWAR